MKRFKYIGKGTLVLVKQNITIIPNSIITEEKYKLIPTMFKDKFEEIKEIKKDVKKEENKELKKETKSKKRGRKKKED